MDRLTNAKEASVPLRLNLASMSVTSIGYTGCRRQQTIDVGEAIVTTRNLLSRFWIK